MGANKPAVNWTNEHGYTDFSSQVYPVPGKVRTIINHQQSLTFSVHCRTEEAFSLLYCDKAR